MNEVLKNWIEIKLEKICSRITKGGTPTTYGYAFQKEGINFIKVENLNKGTVDLRSISDFISQEAHDFQKKSQLQEGDLLFSIAGTIGETCIVKKEILPANTNQALAIIQGFHKVLTPNFLKFQLDSFVARKVTSKARGGAMNNVSLGDLKNLDVLIPPVPEQRAIVAKIEQLFSELDNGITNLKAARGKLEIYRQAVLKKAFEGELTKEWRVQNELDGWREVPITELGDIVTGNTPSKKNEDFYSSREYNFYKPTDLEAGNFVSKSIDSLSLHGFESGRQAPEGSILVTCIGATIGKTGLIKKEGCFNQQINAIIPFEGFDPKFIYYQAIGLDFQTQIKTNASATTLPILNKGKFSKLKMNICSKEEQTQIAQEIESRLSVCDNILANIEEGLEKSEALRQSILKQAFEGKLLSDEELEACRQEPDWEPAEQLLERVKNEKLAKV